MRRLACALILLTACAESAGTDDIDVSGDAAADAADPSVRVAGTTLSVSRTLERRGDTFVLRGKTSRTLTGGNGFVFDDPYGDFAQVSPRVFELSWPASTARSLADGVDQFIGLDFAHSSPAHLTGRVVVRPRAGSFTGSSKIYLTAELTPVVVAGVTYYRLSGHSTTANTDVQVRVDGYPERGVVTRFDDTHFAIDFPAQRAIDLTAGQDLDVLAFFSDGGVEKHARLALSVKKLGLTAGDAYDVWPVPSCTSAVKACLLALPGDAEDTGSCGDARTVTPCRGQVGVTVDDVAMQTTLHTRDARLADPAIQTDAIGLVGAARTDAWLAGAGDTVEQNLEDMFGRWFITASGRDKALAHALDAGIDTAYARPLELVPPAPVVPADAAAMRQVAADAVLARIATMNFVDSDFERTLEQLAHEFRAQHVDSIRAFRETITPEPYPGIPTEDVYIGDWLGAHTEVVVERATGAVVSTLVELD
jgi:hypothetical protein